jgi:chromosome segregation ATPase
MWNLSDVSASLFVTEVGLRDPTEDIEEGSMETALEIRRGKILRDKIEALRDEIAKKWADRGAADADLPRLEKEIRHLETDYLRAIARQADLDYRKKRSEWRAERALGLSPAPLRACS